VKGSFVIFGAPRTKKTHNQIISVSKSGRPIPRLLPSVQYLNWFRDAMTFAPFVRRELEGAGLTLPVACPVQVKALFFRDRDGGDLTGYMQALADFLQAPLNGRIRRNGAGVIEDDKQIESWDGSRLEIDRLRPRIEVTIETLEEGF